MEISICIVSRNRKLALQRTLTIIETLIDKSKHEVLVFLDGCEDDSNSLSKEFPQFLWFESARNIGASPARRVLFAASLGQLIIGFDDDAHPLQHDFIHITERIFSENPNSAVLAFEEIKGIYPNDQSALQNHVPDQKFFCNSFVGCGFAIRKEVYEKTAGFPKWMDIYGEEGCLSIEIIDKGFDILYTSEISVNHRIDRQQRKISGSNIFRFERQLCHMGLYFLVFYPAHLLPQKWAKLFGHNFKKYALIDGKYFKAYCKGLFGFLIKIPKVVFYRKPVSKQTVAKLNSLPHPKYG